MAVVFCFAFVRTSHGVRHCRIARLLEFAEMRVRTCLQKRCISTEGNNLRQLNLFGSFLITKGILKNARMYTTCIFLFIIIDIFQQMSAQLIENGILRKCKLTTTLNYSSGYKDT